MYFGLSPALFRCFNQLAGVSEPTKPFVGLRRHSVSPRKHGEVKRNQQVDSCIPVDGQSLEEQRDAVGWLLRRPQTEAAYDVADPDIQREPVLARDGQYLLR